MTALLGAAALSLITFAIHVFAGGPDVARPLLAAELDPVVKLTMYYGWHIVSLVLLAMPAGFALAALRPESRELAVLMTALAGAFGVWGLALMLWKRQRVRDLPQWLLFLPISALGLLGVWR